MLDEDVIPRTCQDAYAEIVRRYGALVDRTSGAFDFVDVDTQREMITTLKAA